MRSWQDRDIVQILNLEAPRYTSYPSAHHFEPLDPLPYAHALQSLAPETPISLYLHIPFCEQLCHFCGCNTRATLRYAPVRDYVTALLREITMVSDLIGFRPKVHNIHFGGGSPSMLEAKDLSDILEALHVSFEVLPDAEVSIELDPRRVTIDKSKLFKALGFNRASLGVQDTNPEVQVAINRVQPLEQVQAAVESLRANGISHVSLDLVYGLPLQTSKSIHRTMAEVLAFNPDRLAVFSYAHVPWVKKHQNLIDTDALPNTIEKSRTFLDITDFFESAGYKAIGIDHFAKPDDEMTKALKNKTLRRNFMGYSTLPNDYLIGLGASSLGELDFGIAQNIPQSTTYQGRIMAGTLATTKGWIYRHDDKARKAVISALMCYFEVDLDAICQQFGLSADYFDADMKGLEDFIEKGLVRVEHRRISFQSPLKMLVRAVACVFDSYSQSKANQNRYSKIA